MHSINNALERPDNETVIIHLECPGSKVVLLQSLFELYEGAGVVRTVDIRKSLVCILTTPQCLDLCIDILKGCEEMISWRPLPAHDSNLQDFYKVHPIK